MILNKNNSNSDSDVVFTPEIINLAIDNGLKMFLYNYADDIKERKVVFSLINDKYVEEFKKIVESDIRPQSYASSILELKTKFDKLDNYQKQAFVSWLISNAIDQEFYKSV